MISSIFLILCLYLFASPFPAAAEWRVQTELMPKTSSARVTVIYDLAASQLEEASAEIFLDLALSNPQGDTMVSLTISHFDIQEGHLRGTQPLPISDPQGWNAEQPILYSLDLTWRKGSRVLEKATLPIGLRLLRVQNQSLQLNGVALTLRGIIYPSSHAEEQWRHDLGLIQDAHLNTIFLDDLPNPRLLDLCDTLGLYVIAAAPAGDLADVDPSSLLSHPSLIGWQVPSETPNGEERIRELKQWDPTRPVFASAADPKETPVGADIFCPTAPVLEQVLRWTRTSRPMLLRRPALEPASNVELLVQAVQKSSRMIGMILGSESLFPASGDSPAASFLWMQETFSPLEIPPHDSVVAPGPNVVELPLRNGYDFTNLRQTQCRWFMWRDGKSYKNGGILLDVAPHASFDLAVEIEVPDDLADHDYALQVQFDDARRQRLAQPLIRLQPDPWQVAFLMRLRNLERDENWQMKISNEEIRSNHRDYLFTSEANRANWFLLTQDRHIRLILDGPRLRRDRTAPASASGESIAPASTYQNLWMLQRRVDQQKKNVLIETLYRTPEAQANACWMLVTQYFSPFGYIDVEFSLYSEPARSFSKEEGLSFLVSPLLQQVLCLGEGPVEERPGERGLNRFGVHAWQPHDGWRSGMLSRVNLAALMQEKGYGLGIMMLDGALRMEQTEEGLWVTVPFQDRGNRRAAARRADDKTPGVLIGHGTAFRLIPLVRRHIPIAFENAFGLSGS